VKHEVEEQMRDRLRMAADQKDELQRMADRLMEYDVEGFANNLEVARIIYRKHPGLVKANVFPQRYRAAIIKWSGYDPEKRQGVDVEDLHITDPEEARREREEQALESLMKDEAPR
jgi:hypothetical protein